MIISDDVRKDIFGLCVIQGDVSFVRNIDMLPQFVEDPEHVGHVGRTTAIGAKKRKEERKQAESLQCGGRKEIIK